MVTIPLGTKEYLVVDVTDKLGNLTTLAGTSPRYTIEAPDGTNLITDAAAVAVTMKAKCMVDTTTGGPWVTGEYKLWLRFDALPEVPLIGPYEFEAGVGP